MKRLPKWKDLIFNSKAILYFPFVHGLVESFTVSSHKNLKRWSTKFHRTNESYFLVTRDNMHVWNFPRFEDCSTSWLLEPPCNFLFSVELVTDILRTSFRKFCKRNIVNCKLFKFANSDKLKAWTSSSFLWLSFFLGLRVTKASENFPAAEILNTLSN